MILRTALLNPRRSAVIAAISIMILVLAAAGGAKETIEPVTVVSADGVPIVYETVGDGDVAVVLVHCWCCDRSYWQNQIDLLAEKYQVVTVDLAGHGDSGLQRQDYEMSAFAADVAAVVADLDLQKIVLVGHSMGGAVVVETAGLLGDKVIGLIGIDTLHRTSYGFTPEQVDGFLAGMKADFPGHTSAFVRTMFPAEADTTVVTAIADDMAAAPPEVGVSAIRNLLLHDLGPTLDKIDVPIVCIDSRKNPVDTEGWSSYSGGYDVVFMDGVGHFPHREKPEAFNVELKQVIAHLVAGD